jgi:glycerophosphoryl diester phosphodiesterase
MGSALLTAPALAAPEPFLVAHRAANGLRFPETGGAFRPALAEADLRLRGDRIEVRHLKRLGPLPLLWDRWQLAPGWRKRLTLDRLLEVAPTDVELVLDLKGRNSRLSHLVVAELGPHLGKRPLTVCARSWGLLEPFAGLPVRRVHSIGSPRGLRRLEALAAGRRLEGISIHERLLSRESVARVLRLTDLIMTWPVNDARRASELLRLGVRGLITDDPDAVVATLDGA